MKDIKEINTKELVKAIEDFNSLEIMDPIKVPKRITDKTETKLRDSFVEAIETLTEDEEELLPDNVILMYNFIVEDEVEGNKEICVESVEQTVEEKDMEDDKDENRKVSDGQIEKKQNIDSNQTETAFQGNKSEDPEDKESSKKTGSPRKSYKQICRELLDKGVSKEEILEALAKPYLDQGKNKDYAIKRAKATYRAILKERSS